MNNASIIIGNPVLKNLLNELSFPDSSARPAATTFAEAPIIVPLPHKQAPSAKAHANGPQGNRSSGS